MNEYITHEPDDHERNEEQQWARLLAAGDPRAGMALVFIQKLCTAFHELGPAAEAGALREEKLAYLRERLARRVRKLLTLLADNDLTDLPGVAELRDLLTRTRQADRVADLAALAEPVHQANHLLVDALEKRVINPSA